MRMWLVDPSILCRQHLLGDHRECHTMLGVLRRGISIDGYIDGGLYEPARIADWHEALVQEMAKRGYNHKSPLVVDIPLPVRGHIDIKGNYEELKRRCPRCRVKIEAMNE